MRLLATRPRLFLIASWVFSPRGERERGTAGGLVASLSELLLPPSLTHAEAGSVLQSLACLSLIAVFNLGRGRGREGKPKGALLCRGSQASHCGRTRHPMCVFFPALAAQKMAAKSKSGSAGSPIPFYARLYFPLSPRTIHGGMGGAVPRFGKLGRPRKFCFFHYILGKFGICSSFV